MGNSLTLHPAHSGKTYGYHRAGILIALFNSTTLVLIALGIFYEAYQRLLNPPEVAGGLMTVVAALAFIVNLGTALLVKPGSDHDLNQRSAFIHLAGDALSTLANSKRAEIIESFIRERINDQYTANLSKAEILNLIRIRFEIDPANVSDPIDQNNNQGTQL